MTKHIEGNRYLILPGETVVSQTIGDPTIAGPAIADIRRGTNPAVVSALIHKIQERDIQYFLTKARSKDAVDARDRSLCSDELRLNVDASLFPEVKEPDQLVDVSASNR